MQKWCPDPFEPESGTAVFATSGVVPGFEPAEKGILAESSSSDPSTRFRHESGFASDAALMSHLTPDERATVFELVEIDVAEQYEIRAQQKEEEFQLQQETLRQDFEKWAHSFQEETYKELRDISRSCIELAIQLAGKIVREKVTLAPEILAETLATVLYKIPAGQSLNITVNPADEEWLKAHPEIIEELRIGLINGDRRIDRGGCSVESRGQAWDATVSGQLDALGEMVHELVSTLPDADPIPEVSAQLGDVDPGGDDAATLD